MGAWGYQPFENDQACDWIYDFEKKIEKTLARYVHQKGRHHRAARHNIAKATKRRIVVSDRPNARFYTGQHETFAALEAALALSASFGGMRLEIAELALSAIKKLASDVEFVESWERPGRYLFALAWRKGRVESELDDARKRRKRLEAMFRPKRKRKK